MYLTGGMVQNLLRAQYITTDNRQQIASQMPSSFRTGPDSRSLIINTESKTLDAVICDAPLHTKGGATMETFIREM